MKVSACCEAGWDENVGICHECKEHCSGIELSSPIDAFIEQVLTERAKHPHWRYGQALFNVMQDMYPELVRKVRGTEIDPFNADYALDKRVLGFFALLSAELG